MPLRDLLRFELLGDNRAGSAGARGAPAVMPNCRETAAMALQLLPPVPVIMDQKTMAENSGVPSPLKSRS
jgi:hypothetical protein